MRGGTYLLRRVAAVLRLWLAVAVALLGGRSAVGVGGGRGGVSVVVVGVGLVGGWVAGVVVGVGHCGERLDGSWRWEVEGGERWVGGGADRCR